MTSTDPRPPVADDLAGVDAWWRAANYLSVGQIYLLDNPLLAEPLRPEHVKPRLLGHWGTSPGINLVYAHLNRLIRIWRNENSGGQQIAAHPFLPSLGKSIATEKRHLLPLVMQFAAFFEGLAGSHGHGIVLRAEGFNLHLTRRGKPEKRADRFVGAGFGPMGLEDAKLHAVGLGFEQPGVALFGG